MLLKELVHIPDSCATYLFHGRRRSTETSCNVACFVTLDCARETVNPSYYLDLCSVGDGQTKIKQS